MYASMGPGCLDPIKKTRKCQLVSSNIDLTIKKVMLHLRLQIL